MKWNISYLQYDIMAVSACFISLPVISGDDSDILNNLAPVSVDNNKILNAIMDAFGTWEKSPVVWVENFPYRIKLLEHTNNHAILLQICLGVYYKPSGKECYYNISKRKVKIIF